MFLNKNVPSKCSECIPVYMAHVCIRHPSCGNQPLIEGKPISKSFIMQNAAIRLANNHIS